jgi:methyl-accepting chemotaxis protein
LLNRLRRLTIVTRILCIASVELIVLCGALLLVVNKSAQSAMMAQTRSEVIDDNQVLRQLVRPYGTPRLVAGKLHFGDWVANGSVSTVDLSHQLTGAATTLFERMPSGTFVRVSTTVRKADGSRGVGTPLVGPAAAALAGGNDYVGSNPILGQSYLAMYHIIRDAQQRPIGAYLTAVPLANIDQASGNIVRLVLMVALLALGVSLLVLFAVLRPIGRAIRRVAAAASHMAASQIPALQTAIQAVASGDLTCAVTFQSERLDIARADETGELATSFNAMQERLGSVAQAFEQSRLHLQEALSQVSGTSGEVDEGAAQLARASEQIGGASTQIARAIEDVARGAATQSHSASDAMSQMQGLAEAMSHVADGADAQAGAIKRTEEAIASLRGALSQTTATVQAVTEAADQASSTARTGSEAVAQTITSIADARQAVQQSVAHVQALGQRSAEIGQIVAAIDDIAAQTNLLALNAAIEAARAGEHGKGFTVVAAEVRKLAERAGNETKEITQRIEAIQRQVAEVVAAMEAGSGKVEQSVALGQHAEQSLQRILGVVADTSARAGTIHEVVSQMGTSVEAVTQANAQVAQVAQRTQEATTRMQEGTQRVGLAIESIAAASQQSAAGAEEVSASAEEQTASVAELATGAQEQARQAAALQQVVAHFILEQTEQTGTLTPRRREADWARAGRKRAVRAGA